MAITASQFDSLVNPILARRPILKEVIETQGARSIFDYAREHLMNPVSCPFPARQLEFLTVFKSEISRFFGSTIATAAVRQMERFFSVSTADHHGPLTSPFFVNPSLVSAAVATEAPECKQDFIIVFPGANVSLNNSSLPRGFLYQTFVNDKIVTKRLSLVPSMLARGGSSLYGFRPYGQDDLNKIYAALAEAVSKNELPPPRAQALEQCIQKIYGTPEVLGCRDYSDQMTKGNFELWKMFFPEGTHAPDLLYIPMENISVALFLANHVNKKTIVHEAIFNEKYEPLITRLFNGINGAFDLARKEGTYWFWGLSEDKNCMVSLWKEGNFLCDAKHTIKIELTPSAIVEALMKKRLAPNLFFNFMILAFYYGLRCLGGFNQINYLTRMKSQWMEFSREFGATEELVGLGSLQTKGLVGDLTVAYLKGAAEQLIPVTGLDIFLYKNARTFSTITAMSKQLTVAQAIYPLCAEFYRIVVPKEERVEEILKITPDDIAEFLNLGKDIKPCVTL